MNKNLIRVLIVFTLIWLVAGPVTDYLVHYHRTPPPASQEELRDAEWAGWQACSSGVDKAYCSYWDRELRDAWLAGWHTRKAGR